MQYRLTHLGAENSVTGSCHLLQIADLNILIDCGLSQGDDPQIEIEDWPVKPRDIDYCFITHAHIDHTGRLPALIDSGFGGEIICTHATRALITVMLRDAMAFTKKSDGDIHRVSKKIDDLAWGFEYRTDFQLKNGISFKLGNAGHILGSCFVRIASETPQWSVIFSGDIGSVDTPLLPDPEPPCTCDLLVLESTYGDRLHENRRERIENLGKILLRALRDQGKVFIPAFSLGRTQELIYELDRVFSDKAFGRALRQFNQGRKIPVFIDSPLGIQITKIYADLSEFWDREATDLKRKGDHPIDFDHLYAVENYGSHKRILEMKGPMIVIAGSGMCTGGRIISHLKSGIEDPKNDVLFVGYQAQGTLGRDILNYSSYPNGYVSMNNEKVCINAGVYKLYGYSAHADQRGLLDWVKSMPRKPGKIKLVHGEAHAKKVLMEKLKKEGCC